MSHRAGEALTSLWCRGPWEHVALGENKPTGATETTATGPGAVLAMERVERSSTAAPGQA